MASVSLRRLVKYYGDAKVVREIDLDVADTEFVALVGPSGCGKSTTLRMIAGLEDVSSGEILIDGRIVNELMPKERDIAMVFQDYALYPHMSVRENMSFGLSVRKIPKQEIESRVKEAASILDIEELLDRRPRNLSGGQRQRVAMGRAIVRKPKVFLFDEPLSNLDAKLRVQMRTEIKRLHHRVGATIVYVTHDQVEAMTLADRVVVMRSGNIEQIGTPDQVYNHPASMFVAGFIGSPTMNFIPGHLDANGTAIVVGQTGRVSQIPINAAQRGLSQLAGQDVTLGLRPEHISIASGAAHVTSRVELIEPLGSDTLVYFKIGDTEVVARVVPSSTPKPGDSIGLRFDLESSHLFDRETGLRHQAESAGRRQSAGDQQVTRGAGHGTNN